MLFSFYLANELKHHTEQKTRLTKEKSILFSNAWNIEFSLKNGLVHHGYQVVLKTQHPVVYV